MLGVEHIAMLCVAGLLVGWLAIGRHWFAMGAVLLSQLPFWGGLLSHDIIGRHPVTFNMFADMAVSGAFVWLAYKFDKEWLIWLGVVFLCALIVDVYAIAFGMAYYLELHEIMHYTALVLIAGRGAVVRVDRHIRSTLAGVQN